MPLEPTIPTNRNGASDRRARSAKADASVVDAAWPTIGAATYAKLAVAAMRHDDPERAQLNPMQVKLAHARSSLATAMLVMDGAIRQVNPQAKGGTPHPKVYNKLRGLRDQLEELWKEFPLEVRA